MPLLVHGSVSSCTLWTELFPHAAAAFTLCTGDCNCSRGHRAGVQSFLLSERLAYVTTRGGQELQLLGLGKLSEQVHHFNGGQRGIESLIAGLGAGAVDRLLQRVASKDPKDDRNA